MLKDTRTKRLAKFKFIAKLSSDTQRSLFLFLLQRYKLISNSMFVYRFYFFRTKRIGNLKPENNLFVTYSDL